VTLALEQPRPSCAAQQSPEHAPQSCEHVTHVSASLQTPSPLHVELDGNGVVGPTNSTVNVPTGVPLAAVLTTPSRAPAAPLGVQRNNTTEDDTDNVVMSVQSGMNGFADAGIQLPFA
jgi:hypothetical protein